MSAGPFRPSVVDRLELVERLEERIRVVSPLAWVLIAIQCALVAAAVGWALLGHLPVNARGEAVCIEAHGTHAVIGVQALDSDSIPLAARAVLEARDGSHRRYAGRIVELNARAPAPGGAQPVLASLPRAASDPVPVEIDLEANDGRLRPGEHYAVVVTLRQESPAAHLLREWWR